MTFSAQSLLVVATSVVLIGALYVFFGRTLYGKALRATAVNRVGARLVGISPSFAGALTFVLAALLCAFCGVLIGPITTVYYDSGFLVSLKGFVGAIIGGLVSYPLAAAGALLVGLLEVVLVVLGERVQGGDRVHADHPGAAVAQPDDASSRGGRVSSRASRIGDRSLVFAAALFALPLASRRRSGSRSATTSGSTASSRSGLVLLTGVAGQTSFGQAAFVGLGAYTTAYLTTRYGASPWLALPAGLAITLVVALALGFITLRMQGHYLPLATIAWGISLFFLFGNLEWLGGHTGVTGIPPLTLGPMDLKDERHFYVLIWVIALAALWATHNLLDSRPGRALRALKGGLEMAEAFGVNGARAQDHRVRLRGAARVRLRLAVRAPPALRQSDAVRHQPGHRVPVHGGRRRRGQRLGRDHRRDADHAAEADAAGCAAAAPRARGELRDRRVRRADDPAAAVRARTACGRGSRAGCRSARRRRCPMRRRCRPATTKRTAAVALLEVTRARKQFGGLVAVNDLTFDIRAGEILGLIGPNGAGKSTTFALISGALPLTAGEIVFRGESIGSREPYRIARLGIAPHVPARALAAADVGARQRRARRVPAGPRRCAARGACVSTATRKRRTRAEAARADRARRTCRASIRRRRAACRSASSGSSKSRVRWPPIRRCCCSTSPRRDCAISRSRRSRTLLRSLQREGMTILLVEHDMEFVMGLTDRLIVMDFGEKLAEGPPVEIQRDPLVLEAYLGGVYGIDRERRCRRILDVESAVGRVRQGARGARRIAARGDRARSSPSSARTGPARRRCSRRSRACCRRRARSAASAKRPRRGAVEERVRRGLVLVPEKRELFASMSVADNLRLGGFCAATRARAAPGCSPTSMRGFPASPSGATSWPARCRAASARCWRSGAP